MWLDTTTKLNFAATKARHLTKCITSASLLLPELMIATTAVLSHWARTVFLVHCFSHIAAASTIGISSFNVMCDFSRAEFHWSWNHWLPENAPQCTALHACWRELRRDSSSFFETAFSPLHSRTCFLNYCSLSSGNRTSIANVSNSISRKQMVVAGSSHLSSSMGVPVSLHICCMTFILISHSEEPGLPTVMKSSR